MLEVTIGIANPLPLTSTLPYGQFVVWLVRPPYLRYAAAALMILGALWLDLRPTPRVDHPFLAVDVAAGSAIDPDQIEWRPIPPGTLPFVDPAGLASVNLDAGTPLVPALLTSAPIIPADWFALEMPVPDLSTPGSHVRIVVDSQTWTDGIVVATVSDSDDFLSAGRRALIAVPSHAAALVADAARRGSVTVLLGG